MCFFDQKSLSENARHLLEILFFSFPRFFWFLISFDSDSRETNANETAKEFIRVLKTNTTLSEIFGNGMDQKQVANRIERNSQFKERQDSFAQTFVGHKLGLMCGDVDILL